MKHKQAEMWKNLYFIWKLSPASFLEMILFGILNCILSVGGIWAMKQVLSFIQDGYSYQMLWSLATYGVMLILSAGYSVWYARYRVQFHMILEFEKKIRRKLHEKSQRLSNEVFETTRANAMIRMADGARQNLFRYVEIWIHIVMAILQAFIVTIYISTFQIWFLLLLPISTIPPCLNLAYQAKLWKKYYQESEQCKREESEYQKAMIDDTACKESRITQAAALCSRKWEDSRDLRDKIENKKSKKMFWLRILLIPFELLGASGGYLLAVLFLFLGKIDYASCTAAVAAYASLTTAFRSLAEMVGNETQYRQMIQPFFCYWNVPERKGTLQKPSFDESIRLDHVSFRYPEQKQNALEDIDLTIRKGEVVAIVGENGAGKTTLANLILGLFQPSSGTVYYDNRNISLLCEPAIHKNQSIVPQTFQRYKMTVTDNIAIGDFRKRDSEGIAEKFDAFFQDSDLSLETRLGKEFGGRELSGGQWQQLSCARGFYKDSSFLALDEATSAIDPLKEKAMYDTFKKELNGKTGILITHRLGAVLLADRVIVLDHGRVVQSGTHSQLLEEDGLYLKFWNAQTKPFAKE